MPTAPEPITSTPDQSFQPYSATEDGEVDHWQSVDHNSGPVDMQMQVTGEFEDGPGPWRQT